MRNYLLVSSILTLILIGNISAALRGEQSVVLGSRHTKRGKSSGPQPIVVPPSQYWDGDDGQWSSLGLRVGTPAQNVRVLVSTNSPNSLVVYSVGCSAEVINPIPQNCANARGTFFNPNTSSTWKPQGVFGINDGQVGFEANLNYETNADYGLETLGLGFVAGDINGPTLVNQTVAGIASTSPFYTGIFGLGTQPVNYTDLGNFSAPSFFTSLRRQKLIPSLSWSYTAGAKYQLKAGQFSQLIFGGYDSSRFVANTANFTLNNDITRDIVLAVQSISFSGTTQAVLLPKPIYAFIESTDPNFWLPEEACQQFEKAFDISIDKKTQLYLINATHYATLRAAKPTVRFTLANSLSGGKTVDIVLPFEAFALQASTPFTPNSTYYFPLRKAANDTQYTLGRAFLQEAYLSVNYDVGNFSISQCVFDDGASPNVIPFLSSSHDSPTSGKLGLNAGSKAGIAIAAIAFVSIVGVLVFLYIRRKNSRSLVEPIGHTRLADRASCAASPSLIPPKTESEFGEWRSSIERLEEPVITFWKPELHHQRSELSNNTEIRELPTEIQDESYTSATDRMQSVRRAASTSELDVSGGVHELDAGPTSHHLSRVREEEGEMPSPTSSKNHSPRVAQSENSVSPMDSVRSTFPQLPRTTFQDPNKQTSWFNTTPRESLVMAPREPARELQDITSPISPLRHDDSTGEAPIAGPGRFKMRGCPRIGNSLSSNSPH